MNSPSITLKDFFQLEGSVLYNAEKIKITKRFTIDSRSVRKGDCFIAIKGEKFDGHDFINVAVEKGAFVVVANQKKLNTLSNLTVPIVAVEDTKKALGELGEIWRSKLKTKIIAITGSAGKTSTKEILASLLNQKFKVNKTLENNNNHIGVPLTIFSTNNNHDYLILELGTNHFGEIEYTTKIAKPDYALITNIGNSHIEFLKSPSGVFAEKSALLNFVKENDGILFINNDDKFLRSAYKSYRRRITFGIDKTSDVNGKIVGFTKDGKPRLLVDYNFIKTEFSIPLYGIQNAKNFLAAISVAFAVGLSSFEIKRYLKNIRAVDKRVNIKKFKSFTLINDTYNANPESMKMSLQLVSQIGTHKNRIAILGDMFELGKESKRHHENLYLEVIKNKLNSVMTIGKYMRHLHIIVKRAGIESMYFNSRASLHDFLSNKDFADSIILVKGSRGMKMEEFVETIKSNNI